MPPSTLIDRNWCNDFEYYDLTDCIQFNRDGTGQMGWGDGQAMKFEQSFLYSMSRDRVRLTWRDEFGNNARLLHFKIHEGPFEIENHNRMGPAEIVTYQYKAEFDPHPFPDGAKRSDSKLAYYAD